jgi:hypothetical protein
MDSDCHAVLRPPSPRLKPLCISTHQMYKERSAGSLLLSALSLLVAALLHRGLYFILKGSLALIFRVS